jgi:hypothetical protein
MAIPLRTDEPQEINNQKLTTADLAKGQRAATEPKGPRPVMGERMPAEQNLEQAAREPRQRAAAPLFPNKELELCAVAGKKFKLHSWTSPARPSRKPMAWWLPR